MRSFAFLFFVFPPLLPADFRHAARWFCGLYPQIWIQIKTLKSRSEWQRFSCLSDLSVFVFLCVSVKISTAASAGNSVSIMDCVCRQKAGRSHPFYATPLLSVPAHFWIDKRVSLNPHIHLLLVKKCQLLPLHVQTTLVKNAFRKRVRNEDEDRF